jgi:uncharacterized protein (DUF488 family)
MRIMTIGGYGFTEETFVRALKDAHVEMFVDIRRRRGMRGARYAFLNSSRLQKLLASVGIKYLHAVDLAPTTSIRDAQKKEDAASGETKRHRTQLSQEFVERYRSEILSTLDLPSFRARLDGAEVLALFCVESEPLACHRSIVGDYLLSRIGSDNAVEHLRQ